MNTRNAMNMAVSRCPWLFMPPFFHTTKAVTMKKDVSVTPNAAPLCIGSPEKSLSTYHHAISAKSKKVFR